MVPGATVQSVLLATTGVGQAPADQTGATAPPSNATVVAICSPRRHSEDAPGPAIFGSIGGIPLPGHAESPGAREKDSDAMGELLNKPDVFKC
ncbi:hypothetical protein D3C85_1451950 [compost metagenome]